MVKLSCICLLFCTLLFHNPVREKQVGVKYFVNVEKEDSINSIADLLKKYDRLFIIKSGTIKMNSVKDTSIFVKDISLTEQISRKIQTLANASGKFKFDEKKYYFIGDVSLRKDIGTKLFYVNYKTKDADVVYEWIIGLNLKNSQITSVVKFCESSLIIGWFDGIYTQFSQNCFDIVKYTPDIIVKNKTQKDVRLKKLKLKSDGKITII